MKYCFTCCEKVKRSRLKWDQRRHTAAGRLVCPAVVLRLKSSSNAFMWSSLNTLPANWTFITPGGSSLIGPPPSYRSLNSEWLTCSFRGNIRVSLTDRWTSRQLFSSCWCFNKAKLSVVVTFWLSSVSWDMTNIHTAQWEAERCRPGFVSVKERLESPDAGRTSWVDERIHEGGFSLERNLFPLTRLLSLTNNTTFTSSWPSLISSIETIYNVFWRLQTCWFAVSQSVMNFSLQVEETKY